MSKNNTKKFPFFPSVIYLYNELVWKLFLTFVNLDKLLSVNSMAAAVVLMIPLLYSNIIKR